jgi:hypothetical protein
MSSRPGNGTSRAGAIAARVVCLALGGGAVVWGVLVLPVVWRDSGVEQMSVRIENRDSFKPEIVQALLPGVEAAEQAATCRAAALHGAAAIRLRLTETAIVAAERQEIDGRLGDLDATTRRSLACTPADPFLWMALAWLDQTRNGFNPVQLAFLRLAYSLGPNEGWVAVRRNRLALAMYERLTPDLAEAALAEFAGILASGFHVEAMGNLTGPGWPVRDKLLARLKDVPERKREDFAKALYAQGFDVQVPGIPRTEARPWH